MSRRARRTGTLLLVGASAALAVGCNAIFGITDVYLDTADAAGDGAPPGADGAADVTTTNDGTVDAPTTDAPAPDGRPPDDAGARDADAADSGDVLLPDPDASYNDGSTVVQGALGYYADLATDGVNLYMSNSVNNATISTCPLDTCVSGNVTNVASSLPGLGPVRALAAAGGYVYWGNIDGSLHRCAAVGCTDVLLASGQDGIVAIMPSGSTVYWLNQGSNNNGAILSCAAASCGAPVSLTPTPLRFPSSLASDGIGMYWTDADGLGTCAIGSCSPTTAVSGVTKIVEGVAYSGGTLSWMDYDANGTKSSRALTCPTSASCSPTSAYATDSTTRVRAVLSDATRIYVAVETTPDGGSATGALGYCTRPACTSLTTLAVFNGAPSIGKMLAAKGRLYWATTDGEVRTVAIP
jgi:hypothetical protein